MENANLLIRLSQLSTTNLDTTSQLNLDFVAVDAAVFNTYYTCT